ncbi:sensor histidine kinase [Pseudomonas fontis]|uniref:histidine kinase n=1 Tax=Pseudomonas fontis TaxID=2942633 RepID=A0ABT5NVZ4_9PSED|nr:sensor histidine kinase [Pseudomonas fontis]MDD0976834.1 sensor histidine kinase [Pseudomonas fontis]MDD0992356.1 sensor histidine kinase [Pseudomonas fontis]
MFSSLKTLKRCPSGASLLHWTSALLCLASVAANLFLYLQGAPMPASLLTLQLVAMLGIGWQLHQAARSIAMRPQELAERLLQVQESERQRLSRELHDDIGQMLTAAKLQADWLQRRMPEELQAQCTTLRQTLDDTLANVRDVSAILNPRQLASLGLEASLRAHLLRTLENTEVHWSLQCKQRLDGIPEDMAIAAFRITQEAVTNMLRHASATNLIVRIQRTPEGLALSINDDGAGFVPATHPADEGQRGMSGMVERTHLLNGNLTVHSEPGKGTQINALFPWPPRALERANTSKAT